MTVAVWSEEVAPEVMANADYYVEGVPGVEWLLGGSPHGVTAES